MPGSGAQRRGRVGLRSVPDDVRWPLTVAVAHWCLVQLAASLAFRWGTSSDPSPPYRGVLGDPPLMGGLAHHVVEPLRQWDGLWYALIARHGYDPIVVPGEGTFELGARSAFWPLFPWLMDLGHAVSGAAPEAVGYVVANLSFVGAMLVVYRLVALDAGPAIARRTLWAMALFPTALFFSAVYTESLLLFLAAASLLAARTGRWWSAGALGFLAALTRSSGVLLLLPFAILLLQQRGWPPRRWWPVMLPAALPALGPAVFAWYLERSGRDRLDFVAVQEEWNRYQAWPWETLTCGVRSCEPIPGIRDGADWGWFRALVDHPTWTMVTGQGWREWVANSDTLELACTGLFLALAVAGLRRLPPYQSAYVWPTLVIPLFGPSEVHALMSLPRFGLVLFPLFVLMATPLDRPWRTIPAAVISGLLLVLLTIQFASWYWVS